MVRRLSISVATGLLSAMTVGWLSAAATPAGLATADWGAVKGRIVFAGKELPKPQPVEVKKDMEFCGKLAPHDDSLVVDPKTRGIRWAVVWVRQPAAVHPDLAKPSAPAEISNEKCAFNPRIVIAREGTKVKITSSDPVNHNSNIQGFKQSTNPNLPAATPGQRVEIESPELIAESRPVPVTCNYHPWMKGWLVILNHPYATTTDQTGEFELKNVPAGNVTLTIWHESFGWYERKPASLEVVVKPGETVNVGELKFGAN